jgi:hypothetical protein
MKVWEKINSIKDTKHVEKCVGRALGEGGAGVMRYCGYSCEHRDESGICQLADCVYPERDGTTCTDWIGCIDSTIQTEYARLPLVSTTVSIGCVICGGSVPANIPICENCLSALREIIKERGGKGER